MMLIKLFPDGSLDSTGLRNEFGTVHNRYVQGYIDAIESMALALYMTGISLGTINEAVQTGLDAYDDT